MERRDPVPVQWRDGASNMLVTLRPLYGIEFVVVFEVF